MKTSTLSPSAGAPVRTRAVRRIATVHLPCFGLQVAARDEPGLREAPLALEGASPHRGRVVECSRRAAADGVREGQTLASARAACHDLVVLQPDEAAAARARQELFEALLDVVPRVEWAGGGTFHADATGLVRLHGSEAALLVRCAEAALARGFVARTGCASARHVALVAARSRSGPVVVPDGEEARFLEPLPLDLVPVRPELRARLDLLGVRTLGQLARLPEDGLADRFGTEAVRLLRLVRGEDPEPLLPLVDARGPWASRELDEPVSGLEPVTFLLKTCSEDLADDLERRGTAAARLELRVTLDVPPGGCDARVLAPSRPLRSAREILALTKLELETRRLAAALVGVAIGAIEEVPAREAPRELFGRSLDPDALAGAVDRLRAVLGPQAVLTPAPRAAHRREARVGWSAFDPERACREMAAPAAARARLSDPMASRPAERLLERPVPVGVRLPADGHGGEMSVTGGGPEGLPARVMVSACAGPTRVAGEWWDGGADVDRDEYLLLGEDGGVYRVARDRRSRAWTLMAVVD